MTGAMKKSSRTDSKGTRMATSSSTRGMAARSYSRLTLMVPSEFSEGQQVTVGVLDGKASVRVSYLNETH